MRIHESAIRIAMHSTLLKSFHAQVATIVVDELGLAHGRCRADIAVINGRMAGFEIKSDSDSLIRLRAQIREYDNVFDFSSVVVGARHLQAAIKGVPLWWGIVTALPTLDGGLGLKVVRRPRQNPRISRMALARLLWRSEACAILSEYGFSGAELKKPRAWLYRRLARHVDLPDLKRAVRERIKMRVHWRAHPP